MLGRLTLRWALTVPVVLASGACSHVAVPAPVEVEGIYRGAAADGRAVWLDLRQEGIFTFGTGDAGGARFGFAVLGPVRGPAVLAFDGLAVAGDLEVAGGYAAIDSPGLDAAGLERSGASRASAGGVFDGRFRTADRSLSLKLRQEGSVLAGYGSWAGRATAAAGQIAADGSAAVSLLFADSSRLGLTLRPETGSRRLSVSGVGEDVVLRPAGRGGAR